MTLVYGACLGAVLYYVVYRPLQHSTALTKVCASVGVMLYLQATAVLNFGTEAKSTGAVLPSGAVTIAGVPIPIDRMWLTVFVVVVALALAFLYRRTLFGLRTRAGAENEVGAAVVGISSTRIALQNWTIATVLAAASGIVMSPIANLDPGSYTLFIVPALCVALIAGFSSFLGAGCGFGGSCLPKDVSALAAQGRAAGLDMPMLQAVLEVNRTQPERMLHFVRRHHPSLAGLNVAMLGLAFKPDTDDVRESPAWPLLRLLREAGAVVSAFDPVADPWSRPELQGVRRADSLESAVKDAQVVLLVTRWDEFSSLDEVLDRLGIDPLVVDGRRLLVPKRYRRYEGIGRGTTPIAARAGRSAG